MNSFLRRQRQNSSFHGKFVFIVIIFLVLFLHFSLQGTQDKYLLQLVFMSNLEQEAQLRITNEKIAVEDEKIAMQPRRFLSLEKDKAVKDKIIKYLQNLQHEIMSKFLELFDAVEDAKNNSVIIIMLVICG